MKILIITDAWLPQTNGVVRTYQCLTPELEALGHQVRIIEPQMFAWRAPMPGYAEIELALFPSRRLARLIQQDMPDAIHIATEGPLGQAAWRYCRKRALPFTTCFHTMFPDYAARRAAKLSTALDKPVRRYFIKRMRDFHNASSAVMVATPSLEKILGDWHFSAPLRYLTRGARTDLYTPETRTLFNNRIRPVAIYVGRVATEKNLEAFLAMQWPGSKVVVGDGPDLRMLQKRFPHTLFTGTKTGTDLAAQYQSADVFVFPSRTDTFGMVLIEALSCGLPVAAYPVPGPVDIITDPMLGTLDEDLSVAASRALHAPGTRYDRHGYVEERYNWAMAAEQFIDITTSSNATIKLDPGP